MSPNCHFLNFGFMLLWKSRHLPAHAYLRKSQPLVLPDFLVIKRNTLNVPKYCKVLKSFVPKLAPQSSMGPGMHSHYARQNATFPYACACSRALVFPPRTLHFRILGNVSSRPVHLFHPKGLSKTEEEMWPWLVRWLAMAERVVTCVTA